MVSDKLAYETSYPVDLEQRALGQNLSANSSAADEFLQSLVWLLRGLVTATDAVSHDGAAQPDPTTHSWQRATG